MINSQQPTIKVSKETKKLLDSMKIIPRESYDGVIKRLINIKRSKI
jgi:predicted CopG family antitoxin